jgi:hypothetical protein
MLLALRSLRESSGAGDITGHPSLSSLCAAFRSRSTGHRLFQAIAHAPAQSCNRSPYSSDSSFGEISTMEMPPTSILGAGLGGDVSPRMIQLKTQIQF